MNSPRFRSPCLALLAVAVALKAGPAAAQTWTATASGNWSDATNWNGGAGPAPTSGLNTILTFNAADPVTYQATNNFGAFQLNSLTFASSSTVPITVADDATSSLTFVPNSSAVNPTITQTGTGAVAIGTLGASDITLSGNLTINGAGTGLVTLNSNIGQSGGARAVTINSALTLLVNGTNTYTGTTTSNGGAILQIGSDQPFGTGLLILSGTSGQVAAVGGDHTITQAVSVRVNTTFNGTNSLTINGDVTNSNNTGKVFTNNITVAGKALTLGTSGSNSLFLTDDVATAHVLTLAGNSTGSTIINSTIKDVNGTSTTTGSAITLTSNGTVRFNGMNTYSGGISQTIGANTYTGGTVSFTTASHLSIVVGSSSNSGPFTAGPFGTGPVTLVNGSGSVSPFFSAADAARTVNNDFQLGVALKVEGLNNLTIGGAVTLFNNASRNVANTMDPAATLFLNGPINLSQATTDTARTIGFVGTGLTVVNGVIQNGPATTIPAGTALVSKDQAGTLRLTGLNTYTGAGTTIIAGVLEITSIGNVGVPNTLGMSGSGPANFVITGGTLRYIGTSAGSTNRSFRFNGSAAIDASGSAGAPISFTSSTLLNTPTAVGTAPRVLTLTGTNTDANTMSIGLVDRAAGQPDPTAVAKTGTGTWILNGTLSTYSGGTTVSAGTLRVNNTTGSSATGTGPVTVTGGALGGTGFITGAVTIATGGTVAPGNSIGTLNVAGMTWQSGGNYAVEHDPSGTSSDLVNGSGTLDLSALSTSPFTLTLQPVGTLPSSPTQTTYTLATFANGIFGAGGNPATQFGNGADVSSLFTLSGSFTSAPAAYATIIGAPGGPQSLQIQFTPVPEPAFVLLSCGAAGVIGWYRRRRSC
jgi:fibronectin-binding autotransporter adhesin